MDQIETGIERHWREEREAAIAENERRSAAAFMQAMHAMQAGRCEQIQAQYVPCTHFNHSAYNCPTPGGMGGMFGFGQ